MTAGATCLANKESNQILTYLATISKISNFCHIIDGPSCSNLIYSKILKKYFFKKIPLIFNFRKLQIELQGVFALCEFH